MALYHVRRMTEEVARESFRLAGAHGIVADGANGVYYGGADPRRDGAAIGW